MKLQFKRVLVISTIAIVVFSIALTVFDLVYPHWLLRRFGDDRELSLEKREALLKSIVQNQLPGSVEVLRREFDYDADSRWLVLVAEGLLLLGEDGVDALVDCLLELDEHSSARALDAVAELNVRDRRRLACAAATTAAVAECGRAANAVWLLGRLSDRDLRDCGLEEIVLASLREGCDEMAYWAASLLVFSRLEFEGSEFLPCIVQRARRSEDNGLRSRLAWATVELRDRDREQSASAFVEWLKDPCEEVRLAALSGLEALVRGSSVVNWRDILPLLNDESWLVRDRAVKALGAANRTGDVSPYLVPMLADGSQEVRVSAREALSFGILKGPAVGAIVRLWQTTEESSVRRECELVLRDRGSSRRQLENMIRRAEVIIEEPDLSRLIDGVMKDESVLER